MNESLDALREADNLDALWREYDRLSWEYNRQGVPLDADEFDAQAKVRVDRLYARLAIEARVRAEVAAEGRTSWSRAGVSREPRHPGEVFHPGLTVDEERVARGLSKTEMAAQTGFSVQYVGDITNCKRGISVDFALALEKAWGVSAQFWMNLQTSWEIGMEVALREEWERVHGTGVTR